MSTLQSENTLVISRENNRTANITVNDTGNTSGVNTDILVPDINYDYHKTTTSELDNDKNSQFLITSSNQPKNVTGLDSVQNLILKYVKTDTSGTDGSIKWVTDTESSERNVSNEVSQNIVSSSPFVDFFTDIQTHDENFNLSINGEQINSKFRWINLNAGIVDIGLHQLTWNLNKQYYNLIDNQNKNSILNISCSESEDLDFNLKIKYLTTESEQEQTKYICNIFNYNQNIDTLGISCYKINSAEIISNNKTRDFNKGDIELYFKSDPTLQNEQQNNFTKGIEQITVSKVDSDNAVFAYNCDYLNKEYYEKFRDKNLNGDSTESTNINSTETSILHLSELNETLFPRIGKIFELEGGRGRKASIYIRRESENDNSNIIFKINNPGYLYQTGDLLRIKDRKYRNLIYFTVNNINSSSNNVLDGTRFTQEIIKAQHGKSNTIKYALGKKETLLLKDLTISGSTQAKVLVRLIEISKQNINIVENTEDIIGDIDLISQSSLNKQKILKEFYYFNRSNINDIHHINTHILQGSEIYIDVQKLLEASDNDANLLDTLTFNLNGIKIYEDS